ASTLFPYTTLFRSRLDYERTEDREGIGGPRQDPGRQLVPPAGDPDREHEDGHDAGEDPESPRPRGRGDLRLDGRDGRRKTREGPFERHPSGKVRQATRGLSPKSPSPCRSVERDIHDRGRTRFPFGSARSRSIASSWTRTKSM